MSFDQAIIQYIVKHFGICYVQAVYQKMEQLKFQLIQPSRSVDFPGSLLLLETVISLTDSTFP
jgi:hypothetical protein